MMVPRAVQMLQACDTVIGYKLYIEQIRDLLVDKEVYLSELTQEVERATLAVQLAWNGKRVLYRFQWRCWYLWHGGISS